MTPCAEAPGFPAAALRQARRRTLVGPFVYGLSIAVAFLNAVASRSTPSWPSTSGCPYVTASDQAAQADSAPDGSSPRRVSRANRYGDPDE
jgi:hypothetical protein